MISSQSFLPAVADALSSAIMAIAYFAGAIASLAIHISIKFQDTGETLLAARIRNDIEPLVYSSNVGLW
ncbi:hypothetical protein ACHAWO_007260 [Cyclotella atomus]|uniref:Uncharacterized protein n=1 Tax=Cyclotella atomus TaxID=382360 RepID=A0ABD3NTY7_9STRA